LNNIWGGEEDPLILKLGCWGCIYGCTEVVVWGNSHLGFPQVGGPLASPLHIHQHHPHYFPHFPRYRHPPLMATHLSHNNSITIQFFCWDTLGKVNSTYFAGSICLCLPLCQLRSCGPEWLHQSSHPKSEAQECQISPHGPRLGQ